MDDSTNQPGRKAYDALIKVGDAIETPDRELWVVTDVLPEQLHVTSAYRDVDGRICADGYEPTHTVLPSEYVTKVADARQVRR